MANELSKTDKTNKKPIYIKSAILGVITAALFMLIFSAIILFFNLDRAYAQPFATISVAVGTFVAANYAAKKIGDKGYLTGLIIGGVVFVIITVISMILNESGFTLNTLFHFIIIMLSSLTGGIIGVNRDKNKKYI